MCFIMTVRQVTDSSSSRCSVMTHCRYTMDRGGQRRHGRLKRHAARGVAGSKVEDKQLETDVERQQGHSRGAVSVWFWCGFVDELSRVAVRKADIAAPQHSQFA
jgi:hypothetical protein